MRRYILGLILLMFNLNAFAAQPCDVGVSIEGGPALFNPFNPTSTPITLTISKTNSGNYNNLNIKFDNPLSASSLNNYPNYVIKIGSTTYFDNTATNFGNFSTQNLSFGTPLTFNLIFTPVSQSSNDLARGAMSGELEVPLNISGNCDNPSPSKTIKIPVQIPTERNVALSGSFSDNSASFDWDVGSVASNETTQNQTLYLWSNALYKITASSANGGVMKRTDGSTNAINELPYTLKFGDSSSPILTLDQSAAPNTPVVSAQQGRTIVGGQSINVQLTTQDTGKRAGTYTDTVTVKIEAAP